MSRLEASNMWLNPTCVPRPGVKTLELLVVKTSLHILTRSGVSG